MRCFALLLCTLVAVVFALVNGKELAERQQDLLRNAASMRDGLLSLDEPTFDTLLATPRNYSVSVLFTATAPRFGCTACVMFQDPYSHVSRGWKGHRDSARHVFARVEALDAVNLFRRVR